MPQNPTRQVHALLGGFYYTLALDAVPSGRYNNFMKLNQNSLSTRLLILDAANRVILDNGTNALTLDSVAKQAGVSKGGLLYHFPNKESLIIGMVERFIAEFDTAIDKEIQKNGGDWLRAYIHVSFENNPEREQISCALFAAFANNPDLLEPLRKKIVEWQKKIEANAISPEVGTIIRLTIDGMWLSDLMDFAPPALSLRKKILNSLLEMNVKGSGTK
jgi:AcrR family transcriptional regulator